MGTMTNRTASGRTLQNWGLCSAPCIRVLVTAVIFVLLCSSCGSSGNAAVHEPDMQPAPTEGINNPDAPQPAMSPRPPSDAPGPTMTALPSGTVYVPQGEVAKVFAEPYLDSAVVATLDSGALVEILCTAQGDLVSSDVSGARSTLWDKTRGGYIPDVNVDTGTTQPVARSCS